MCLVSQPRRKNAKRPHEYTAAPLWRNLILLLTLPRVTGTHLWLTPVSLWEIRGRAHKASPRANTSSCAWPRVGQEPAGTFMSDRLQQLPRRTKEDGWRENRCSGKPKWDWGTCNKSGQLPPLSSPSPPPIHLQTLLTDLQFLGSFCIPNLETGDCWVADGWQVFVYSLADSLCYFLMNLPKRDGFQHRGKKR